MPQKDPRGKLRAAIEALELPACARVLVAVSGGSDSVALLRALSELAGVRQHVETEAEEKGCRFSLRIGHVNHALREEESNEDEAFVVDRGRDLNIPVEVARVPIKSGSAEEERSRRGRYKALFAMLDAWPGDFLATAHTADDQAETVLMNIVRGSGSRGLGAMHYGPTDQLIRPFLSVTHADILAALAAWDEEYRSDSSNLTNRFLRNRIRADVMPLLERENPGFVLHASHLTGLQAADVSYLESEARRLLELVAERSTTGWRGSSASIRSLHLSLRRQVVRWVLREMSGKESDYETVERSLDVIDRGGTLMVAGARRLRSDGRTFELAHAGQPPERVASLKLRIPGEVRTPAGTVRAGNLRGFREGIHDVIATAGPLVALCDRAKIGSSLVIRSLEPGDRVKLLGAGGSKKLHDILVDRKIPKELREHIPVVMRNGQIVWLAGLALSAEFAASSDCKGVVRLTFEPAIPELRDKMLG